MAGRSPTAKPPVLLRYGGALAMVALATMVRSGLDPVIGPRAPFLLFFPAVMAAGWYGGLGPGLLATLMSAVLAHTLWIGPESGPSLSNPVTVVQVVAFLGTGVLMSVLNEWLHRARRRAEEEAARSQQAEQRLRRAQAEARETETRFRIMADTAPVLIWMEGTDRKRDWFNKSWLEFTGRDLGQELGGGWMANLHGDDRHPFLEAHAQAFEARRPFTLEYRLRRQGGDDRWLLETGVPRYSPEGAFEGYIGSCIDITERRLRHQELEVTNRINQSLLSQLEIEPLVQQLTDEATAITRAEFGSFFYNVVRPGHESYTLYTLSGVPRESFAGFPMPRNTKVFGATFRGEGIVRADDITLDSRYGQNPPFHGMPKGHLPVRSYLAAPVVSRSGGVLGGLFLGHSEPGVFTEEDEHLLARIATQAALALDNATLYRDMREAREEAESANRTKDEFLATVSHELRTPLNAILGWGQILLHDGIKEERRQHGLETIVRNAKLQAQLIDDLLDVSRITSGKMRLDVRPVDLTPVIDAAVAAVGPAAEAKQIRLRKVLDPLAGPVAGDPARLQQVVWNLLSNAVKFTPKAGKVEVRLERVNSHVEIIVADTGAGISPEFLPHVFDRFRQLDSSTTRRAGGLGLGLAIVRHLVELHGGNVRAKSPGEGEGSTFIVILPVSVAHLTPVDGLRVHPTAEAEEGCKDDPALNLQGIRVLVVDDEPDARETLRQILEHCDAEVRTAASAAEALELLQSWRPDVLLSDIGMPGDDGYSLVRRVRELPPERGGQTPAAALTAFARGEDRRRALLAGFQMHVAKPVDVQELAAVVASLVRGARSSPAAPDPIVIADDPPPPPNRSPSP